MRLQQPSAFLGEMVYGSLLTIGEIVSKGADIFLPS